MHHERLGGRDSAGNGQMAHKIPAAVSHRHGLQSQSRLNPENYYYHKRNYTTGASTEKMVGDRSHGVGRSLPWRNYHEAKEIGFFHRFLVV